MSVDKIPFYLFRTAAVLNAISVPGHIAFGWKNLDPSMKTLSADSKHALAVASAHVGWEHMTVGIFSAAVLNYHWSNIGGPREVHEKAIFWALLAGGWYTGVQYWKVKEFRPLGCLWVAPLCSLVAWGLLSRQ